MKKSEIITVKISDLVLNKGTQMRASLDQKWIDELAAKIIENKDKKPEDLKPEDKLDPIKAVRDPEGHIIVWDGFHRTNAHKKAKVTEVDVEVQDGDLALARRLAYGANAKHGVRRSRADIKFVVAKILADKEIMASNPSNMELARITGISEFSFRKARPVQAGEGARTSTTKKGATRKVSTKNIGKGKGGGKASTSKSNGTTTRKEGGTTVVVDKGTGSGGSGTPEKPTLDSLDADLQRAIRKVSNVIGGKPGEALRDALVDGSLGLSRRDIMDFANTSDDRIKKLYPLVVEYRMKPNSAIRVIDTPVDGKTKVSDLLLSVVASGGWLEEKVEGEANVTILVIDRNKFELPSRFVHTKKEGAAPEGDKAPTGKAASTKAASKKDKTASAPAASETPQVAETPAATDTPATGEEAPASPETPAAASGEETID